MKTHNLLALILLLVSGLVSVHGGEPSVLLVNDADNKLQTIPWVDGLTLGAVLIQRETNGDFTSRAYIISQGHIQKYSKLMSTEVQQVKVASGDIIILGGLSDERRVKLRANPELEAAFNSLETDK